MTEIAFDDVSITYATAADPAVSDVSVEIDAGSLVGITGPSESGKTTFCRALGGFVPNFFDVSLDGSVRVAGIDVGRATIADLGETVGYVFENPNDQLTGAATSVRDEIAFGLEQRGVDGDALRPRIASALSTVGVEHLVDRDLDALSGGQLQRVALASVLALDPEILVLDEPTSRLDPAGTDAVFETAATLRDEGYTVVAVSQHLRKLASVADRLLVFDEGGLVRNGPPRSVLADRDLDPILRVPLTVRIARRLRDDGTIPAGCPLPLTVSALRQQIDRSVADGSASDEPAVTRSPADDPATEDDGVQPGSDPISPQSGGEVPRIRLDDVTHVYDGGVPGLEHVSLDLAGECVMLMGANGAGKTTLVKHLNGLLAPTTGTVLVGESDTRTASVAALARRVGLVFQDPDTQLFRPTVEQAVRFGLENLGAPDVATRTNRALERLSLADVRTESTYELGRAGRKRVAMASVLAMDTPVVVLDEPTGEQDARGVATIGSLVESLTTAGRTVICVTHDVEFARRHGDRIVVLADGRVIADGPPPTVLGDPEPLAQAGLEMPVPMRLGRALGLGPLPSVDRLLARLSTTSSRRST